MSVRLITIPFSHYCEKARWALDRCGIDYQEDGHLPIMHWLPARRAGGGRTVPILVAGDEVVADSTDIVRWADRQAPCGLIPADRAGRAEVDELEEYFDQVLGPHARRWAYHQVLGDRKLSREMDGFPVPAWERRTLTVFRPLAFALLRRGMNITAETAERSRARVDESFDRAAGILADGRRYLAGDRFTAADLTFAALAAPVLFPDGHPVPLPAVERFSGEVQAAVAAWRGHPAGRFALRLYAEQRRNREAVRR